MELVEGRAVVGVDADGAAEPFPDVEAFVTRLGEIREVHGAAVQAVDARYVAGRAHLERAVALATRAHERADAIADDRAVEILLYAAGRRQINRALELGVGEGETPVVVVVDGGDEAAAAEAVRELLAPAEALDAGERDRIREFFDVSLRELEATDASLEDLICERVALLVVER
jgi:KEOPS complex subunit Cgi121